MKGEIFLEYIKNIDLSVLVEHLILPTIILVFSLIVGITVNKILKNKLAQHINEDSDIQNIFFRALQGVPIYLCLILGLYWVVNTSALPASLSNLFSYILFTMIIFSLTQVFEKTLSGFIKLKFSSSGDSTQSTLLDTIFKVAVYASGVLIVLNYYGISIAPIITAMGVGGMAVAFGIKETLENIFSGLQIIISKQIRVNDYIILNTGDEGRVTDINWRYISIQPPTSANVVVIPNKVIATAVTKNCSLPYENLMISIPVGVAYDSDLEQVERVTLEVATKILMKYDKYEPHFNENGEDTAPFHPVVRFTKFSDSSIDFLAVMYAKTFERQSVIKHEFIKALTKRFREEGINIPFPIRTVINPTKN